MSLLKVEINSNDEINKLLSSYYDNSFGKDEEVRNNYAIGLLKDWQKTSNIPFLGVEKYYDYWYLVQLYSRDKHINQDGSRYDLNFLAKEVYIEKFNDFDVNKNTEILKKMFEIFVKSGNKFINNKTNKVTRLLSRVDSDLLIEKTSKEVLAFFGFDIDKYCLKHISLDIFLQCYKMGLWGKDDFFTHLDGYRLRDDDIVSALFAGHKKYGGASYIDAFTMETQIDNLMSRYIIIKK